MGPRSANRSERAVRTASVSSGRVAAGTTADSSSLTSHSTLSEARRALRNGRRGRARGSPTASASSVVCPRRARRVLRDPVRREDVQRRRPGRRCAGLRLTVRRVRRSTRRTTPRRPLRRIMGARPVGPGRPPGARRRRGAPVEPLSGDRDAARRQHAELGVRSAARGVPHPPHAAGRRTSRSSSHCCWSGSGGTRPRARCASPPLAATVAGSVYGLSGGSSATATTTGSASTCISRSRSRASNGPCAHGAARRSCSWR